MKDFQNHKLYNPRDSKAPESLAEKLRMYRKKQHLSLEQAEEETKVRLKYLIALEKGDYSQLPEDVYTIGFLSKYADFLDASKEELIRDYRQERGSIGRPRSITLKTQVKESRVFLTPRIIILGLVFLGLIGIIGYISYSIKNFTSAPNLELSSPVTDQVIRQDNVEVVGKTDTGVTLKINDQVILIDDKGNFHETVKLQSGLNTIELRATNRLKKETVKIVKILAEY
ncbi:MAG: family transcriptional regulator [Candidatus Berkelbacteria bacterium]|nr:family transcriptional regulator [Candidatus Berkelbacteria bacterium]